MSKPNYIKALKNLSDSNPKIEDIDSLEKEIYSIGSDRTTAIMLASSLEENLRRYLLFSMNSKLSSDDKTRIFDYNGFAGTLSAKISVAWAFNLIGPIIRADLELIKEIRNAFAHSRIALSFLSKEMSDICAHLRIVQLSSAHAPYRYFECIPAQEMPEAKSLDHPKTRFIAACHLISYRLHQKVHGPMPGDIAFMEEELLP